MGHARQHFQRVNAAAQAATAAPDAPMQGTEHQLLMAQLYEHVKALKAIKSVEKKIDAKRGFVAAYDNYLDAVLAAGRGAPDPLVTTLMVWQIDVGHYERALQLAAYVLQHRLKLPDQYNRDAATLLADEFSTAALGGAMPADVQTHLLTRVGQLTAESDMHDQARAKLHKAMGYALIGKHGSAEPDLDKVSNDYVLMADTHLTRALALNPQAGVKKDLERLARRLKGVPASDPADPRPGGPVGDGTDAPASKA